jgi:hypothetical protein
MFFSVESLGTIKMNTTMCLLIHKNRQSLHKSNGLGISNSKIGIPGKESKNLISVTKHRIR